MKAYKHYKNLSEVHNEDFYTSDYFLSRLSTYKTLKGHNGCVNSIQFDTTGRYLVSGSDDRKINIYDLHKTHYGTKDAGSILSVSTSHSSNIFATKFLTRSVNYEMPKEIISSAADGTVLFTDLARYTDNATFVPYDTFKCHSDMVFDVEPDVLHEKVFFSCSNDGTVNQYDLRVRNSCDCYSCNRHLIIDIGSGFKPKGVKYYDYIRNPNFDSFEVNDECKSQFPITGARNSTSRALLMYIRRMQGRELGVMAMSINPTDPNYIALGCSDGMVRVYDRRFLKEITEITELSEFSEAESPAKESYKGIVYMFSPPHLRAKVVLELVNKNKRRSKESSDEASGDEVAMDNTDEDEREEDSHFEYPLSAEDTDEDELQFLEEMDPIMTTSIQYEPCGSGELLVSYADGHLYLIKPSGYEKKSFDGKLIYYKNIQPTTGDFRRPATRLYDFLDELYEEQSSLGKRSRSESSLRSNSKDNEPVLKLPLFDESLTNRYEEDVVSLFVGHRNRRTMIKEARFMTYGGQLDLFPKRDQLDEIWDGSDVILSGSDEGHLFIWKRGCSLPYEIIKADGEVVNCVQINPSTGIIACSGIDNTIKLISSGPGFGKELDDMELTKNNAESVYKSALKHYRTLHAVTCINLLSINREISNQYKKPKDCELPHGLVCKLKRWYYEILDSEGKNEKQGFDKMFKNIFKYKK